MDKTLISTYKTKEYIFIHQSKKCWDRLCEILIFEGLINLFQWHNIWEWNVNASSIHMMPNREIKRQGNKRLRKVWIEK